MATETTTGGEQLKRVREGAGLSQSALARKAKLSQPYVWQIENGERPLSVYAATLVEIALDLDERSLVRYAEDLPGTLASLIPGYLNWGQQGLAALTSPLVPSSVPA